MKIEIIAVGNEILSGKTINTNAAYISKKLLNAGYEVFYHTTLKDDEVELKEGLKKALDRADVLILMGGLGPTIDDNTKEIVSNFFNVPLEYREDIAKDLEKRFNKLPSIKEQSTLPKSATIFKNEIGTAPGMAFLLSNKAIILLPGVPSELKNMFDKTALSFIQKNFPIEEKIYQERIDIFLLEEIEVDNFLKEINQDESIVLGIYPGYGIIHVTITTKAKNEAQAKEKIGLVKNQIVSKFSDNIFESEKGLIEEAIHNIFCKNKDTLAFAESCSGGALASRITSLAGSSKYFLGSFVTYSNELKKNMLKVSEKTLKEKGAVSIETATEMVDGVFKLTDASFAVAISGIAGPTGGTKEKPVGTVAIAVGKREGEIDAGILHFHGPRSVIVDASVNFALGILYKRISQNKLYFNA